MGRREGTLEDVVKTWQGRRVFLTGHTGFKGSWLALWLKRLGAEIRGYALDPCTEPNLFALASVDKALDDVRGDIRDHAKLEAAMIEFRPEVVFHLAAQPLVRRSYSDPMGTYNTNVMGTVHVLEAIRKTPSVRAVVCVTTDKCYQNQEWIWPYRENDPLGGYDPYASSKACAEIVSAAYRTSFFPLDRLDEHHVGVATARAGNVIGGGDWSEDRLIPDLVRGFRSGRPVLIRRPDAIRPWQHVLEPLHGYITLAKQLLAEPAGSPPPSTSDHAMTTSGQSGASPPSWCRFGVMAHLGLAILFRACTKTMFSGSMPARPASNSDGNQSSGSKPLWNGRWCGTAPGIKGKMWRSSREDRSWNMRILVLSDCPVYRPSSPSER